MDSILTTALLYLGWSNSLCKILTCCEHSLLCGVPIKASGLANTPFAASRVCLHSFLLQPVWAELSFLLPFFICLDASCSKVSRVQPILDGGSFNRSLLQLVLGAATCCVNVLFLHRFLVSTIFDCLFFRLSSFQPFWVCCLNSCFFQLCSGRVILFWQVSLSCSGSLQHVPGFNIGW